ncbi:MAG: XdhC/CoxI family protein [Myxococcales bacterium]|jgi:xanthine/CO dehydrogenase XdhC/CoxF family maturation factor
MLIGAHGRIAGGVSSGCLERDLVQRIEWLTQDGPRVMTYETAADGDEQQRDYLGCGGTIRVLLEHAQPSALSLLERVARRKGACAILTVLQSENAHIAAGAKALHDGHAATDHGAGGPAPDWRAACSAHVRECLAQRAHLHRTITTGNATGSAHVLIEYVPPPRRLLVAGRHYDTAALVRLATELGWQVCLAAEGSTGELGPAAERIALDARALRAWFADNPHAAMVIMTHSIPLDRLCIETALRGCELPYVAVLGPADRTHKLLAAIEEREPLPAGAAERLRAPAGLPLGGEGPAAIALSVLAELEQTFARRIPKA